jgi:cytochrome c2
VGVKGTFDASGKLTAVGIRCSLCHSTVDNSFAPGLGKRLDGWPNRDLGVGKIISLAPNLAPVEKLLGVNDATLKKVLLSWGPGKFDASVFFDGKGLHPDGRSAATLIPAAFGLAGVDLATYTGWGSVPYWNAMVATNEMHGVGRFFDARLAGAKKFPIAAKSKINDVKADRDLVTGKLAALHFYQLALPAPKPPAGSFDAQAAARGQAVFNGVAKCASCHVPPLFTEPGNNLHTPAESGIDAFHAKRGPTGKYRTTPLVGLFTKQKGGFYHDGRFATLADVVDHYDRHLKLQLEKDQKTELAAYLLSL